MQKGAIVAAAGLSLLACSDGDGEPSESRPVTFELTIENVSGGADVPTPIAPGVWVLHTDGHPLFVAGEVDAGNGLEDLAEDGDPGPLTDSLTDADYTIGPFDSEFEGYDVGAKRPGDSFTFSVTASPGDRLSLATMVVETNDYFVAFEDEGLALFDADGEPISGEVAAKIWDAGTEVDQPMGEGADQPMRQSAHDIGETEGAVIEESELSASDFVTITIAIVDPESE